VATAPDPAPPVVLLVHGAWHGAWCWAALQAELDRRDLASYAVDLPGHGASTLPLGDLHADADLVADAIRSVGRDGGPVVLVGHSYGGAVVTAAAARAPRVAHLVYLAAFVPDAGESVMELVARMPPAPSALAAALVRRDDGSSTLVADLATGALYGRCDPAVAAAAVRRLSPQPGITLQQPPGAAPWRQIPSTYVRCTDDRAVPLEHQTWMSERCGRVDTLDADHSPFLSAVAGTADVLERICDRIHDGAPA